MATTTPIAFFIFRRPATTALVVEAIRAAQPGHLFVIADGPRSGNEAEAAGCLETRSLVAGVDWPGRVETNFSDENLGCRARMSTGLNWVFSRVPEAIILEDDCIPHPTFFPYCEELLDRYRDEPRVMHIGGTSFFPNDNPDDESYRFTRYAHVWGWATWRRAWQRYDVRMAAWPELRETPWLRSLFRDRSEAAHWRGIFDRTHGGDIDTWDYQWFFACLAANGLGAIPRCNLIENVGFAPDATHTKGASPWAAMRLEPMRFPLKHPVGILADLAKDRRHFSRVIRPRGTIPARARRLARRVLRWAIHASERSG